MRLRTTLGPIVASLAFVATLTACEPPPSTSSAPHAVTRSVPTNAQGDQDSPAVASSPHGSLVAWHEEQGPGLYSSVRGIKATRVDPAGNLLDPTGILIAENADSSYDLASPAVAWNGSRYLVASITDQNGGGVAFVNGAFVDPSTGQVSGRFSLAPLDGGVFSDLALASDGSQFLAVWGYTDFNDSPRLAAARISGSASGQFEPDLISISDQLGRDPSVAWDGSRFLVGWEDLRGATSDIRATRVTASGVVQDPAGKLVSGAPGAQLGATVAARPGGFLVAWQDQRTGAFDVRAARVSDAGALPDPAGIVVAGGAGDQVSPAAAWNGSQFLVGWEASTDVRAARVSTAGTVVDPSGFLVSGTPAAQTTPAAAGHGSNVTIAWIDGRTPRAGTDIFGAQVSGTAVSPPDGRLVSQGPAPQRCPDVAFNGTDYFVVWAEARLAGRLDIFGARVSPGGVMRDPAGIAISQARGPQTCPAVDWNGSRFFVAWADRRSGGSDIYGTVVSSAGVVAVPGGEPLSTAPGDQLFVDVSANANAFLVAWEDHRADRGDIRGVRLSPTGAVLDAAPLALAVAPNAQVTPDLTARGSGFLAVWSDTRAGGFAQIRATRLGNTGPPLDPSGRVVASPSCCDAIEPVVAWSAPAQRFLVGWAAGEESVPVNGLAVTRLTASAEVLDPDGIGLRAGAQGADFHHMRDVTWNGSWFVVVFEGLLAPGSSGPYVSQLSGLAVGSGGGQRPLFQIARGAPGDVLAAASRGPGEEVGVAYELLTMSVCCADPRTPYTGADRVFLQTAT